MNNNNLPDIGQKNSCPYINNAQTRGIGIILKENDHLLSMKEQNNEDEILNNAKIPDYSSIKNVFGKENNDELSEDLPFSNTKTHSQEDNKIIGIQPEIELIKDNRENVFKIINTKLGRKRKDKLNSPGKDKKKTHTKFEKGNINQKIKVRFLKDAIKYSNELYEKYQKEKCDKFIKMLSREDGSPLTPLTKEEMKNFLSLKLAKIFSWKISGRCKNEINENYNKDNIKKLMEKGEPKELVDFLNLAVQDAYTIYIREGKDKIPEFNYQNYVNKIKKDEINGKGECYRDKFRTNANSFLENIKNS